MSQFRVGVDIGGTFTDIVFLDEDGHVRTKKVSSTVDDYAQAIVNGLAEVFEEQGLRGEDIVELLHGTTVGSNAILEMKGARTGLITTEGFRDVLEIRTLRMPRLYDLHWEKPPPLIERYLRRAVKERIDTNGNIDTPLDLADAERKVQMLLDENVEAIAVCLINSYTNPVHEQAIAEIIRAKAPDLPFCISFDVLPEMKEYERTSTTVINTYVMPIVKGYLESLRSELNSSNIPAPLMLMQSNGGLMTSEAAIRLPANIIESGPAGGVIGAQALSRKLNMPDIITFDMGGTTAKASLIEGSEVTRSLEYQVGGGIMIGSRLMTGGGYTLKVPAIDLAEVGAGGGSIIKVDAGGSIQVGPQSAGAHPGPVCYDLGGTEPTVTDANVVLGYINPGHLVGGAVKLNPDKSRSALEETVARPVGLDVAHAAYGAHQIAASNMIRALKAVSSERGRDPRKYAMLAFGGNGPLFAAGMAKALRMTKIVVPPSPGLFSSFGLLYADVEHHYSRTVRRVLLNSDPAELTAVWQELEDAARSQLQSDGFTAKQMRFQRAANMHYKGQIFELNTPAPDGEIDAAAVATLEESFGQEHERTYGHRAGPEEPVELVNIMLVGQGISDLPRVPDQLISENVAAEEALPSRQAYFGPDAGWIETSVLRRGDLASAKTGPCIVEEYDATCLVPPGATASLDAFGNIIINLEQ
jgi:N-methylhydantoinase A